MPLSRRTRTFICAAPSVTYGARTSRILSQGKPANHVLAITSPTPFFPRRVGAALISPVKKLTPKRINRRSIGVQPVVVGKATKIELGGGGEGCTRASAGKTTRMPQQ